MGAIGLVASSTSNIEAMRKNVQNIVNNKWVDVDITHAIETLTVFQAHKYSAAYQSATFLIDVLGVPGLVWANSVRFCKMDLNI